MIPRITWAYGTVYFMLAVYSTGGVIRCGEARADVVTEWNRVVLEAIQSDRTNPPRATRVLAMVHTAMYDAVNGIERTHEPYAIIRPAPPGASPEAAAAMAAYTVLANLYPDPKLVDFFDRKLDRSLVGLKAAPARQKGLAWGRFCGNQILNLRKHDGADVYIMHTLIDACGHWRPTPPNFLPPLLPGWPYVTPFTMISQDQFRAIPPPECDSLDYALAFHEVKELGGWDSPYRTAEQTQIAFFWEDGPGSVTPPGHWHVIASQLANRFGNTMPQNARMFALLSLSQADAAISCWDNKFLYDHWRPVTGIELADDDHNPLTQADPTWAPLLPTPPFPAYTSGHSTFSSASAELLELFFDDRDIAFSAPSPNPEIWPDFLLDQHGDPVVRSWANLREAAEEAGQSRIYGGIHWQYDNTAALDAGREIAKYVFTVFLPSNR